jgi:hypothetical protein
MGEASPRLQAAPVRLETPRQLTALVHHHLAGSVIRFKVMTIERATR